MVVKLYIDYIIYCGRVSWRWSAAATRRGYPCWHRGAAANCRTVAATAVVLL